MLLDTWIKMFGTQARFRSRNGNSYVLSDQYHLVVCAVCHVLLLHPTLTLCHRFFLKRQLPQHLVPTTNSFLMCFRVHP